MRLRWLARAFVAVLGLGMAVGVTAGPAAAAPYAAIVMDMRTGEVVHSDGADRRQHPASLTKMMTLYLAFEALESGQLRLDQRVRVSRHAARQPASKLYLRQGQRVSIRSLVRATAVKSANDAAMVLAEAISGSQRAFADLMTRRARQLGMGSTSFRNPHGLTQQGHLSTARDMALLARHLYFDYPQYYNLFGRTAARAAGKTVYTTNALLRTYRGAEGMKTGYTRAAGYNLVGIAKRGDRRVIAVVMGGKSSRWRNDRVANLLDLGFRKTPARVAERRPVAARGAVAQAPVPPTRPGAGRATGVAAIPDMLSVGDAVAAVRRDLSELAPLYAEVPVVRPDRTVSGDATAARRVARAVGVPVPEERPSGWQVQVGAYRERSDAARRLAGLSLAGLPMLAAAAPDIAQERSRSGRPLYKVRFIGLERDEARDACARMKRRGQDCLALAPRG